MQTVQIFQLEKLYEKTFGSKPFHVPPASNSADAVEPFLLQQMSPSSKYSPKGSILSETLQGVEVWLPVRFFDGSALLMYLPYTVVKITGKKTIIETAVAERRGTVKEQFNIDDYSISVKGFLIGEDRQWPEAQLEQLRSLYEKGSAVTMDNALTNIFLTDPSLSNDEQRRVVIKDLDIAEVTGGRIHVRPFSFNISSDCVFTLELND
jgi:hypothetical protein